ncbi:hypothetical protein AEAC466_13490 [Asticcacaulis sp. AC466]|uniref:DUF6950 family protein n=1 Tax=Asticcacaulis sp. AC466 TaxID=1282362 RepID=UPI0003C401AF|nr:hypothetical protein [Asticcacaulis sp. AC466]ESQ83260.1 hypothetical protein AEAC466_13490 [Asticcacaulis sp. AC466]
MTHELIRRARAAEALVAQYEHAPYRLGKADCVRMVANHLRRMGHAVSLIKGGTYSTPRGAVKALAKAGFDSLEAALDARFIRIPPAAALTGDVVAMESDFPLSALAVCLSNNAVLHTQGGGFAISRPLQCLAAWRVPCLKAVDHG